VPTERSYQKVVEKILACLDHADSAKSVNAPTFGSWLDLSDEEKRALAKLLRRAIDDDRYPLSPRVQ